MANDVKSVGEIISAEDVVTSPRGRTATYDEDILKSFEKVKPGQAMRVTIFGTSTEKNDQSAIAQKIRNHWKKVFNDTPSINWAPDGTPQVRHSDKSVLMVQYKANQKVSA